MSIFACNGTVKKTKTKYYLAHVRKTSFEIITKESSRKVKWGREVIAMTKMQSVCTAHASDKV